MSCLYTFQGCLLPYTNTGTIQEISEISCPGSDIPVQSSAFRSVHSTLGLHCNNKEVKLRPIQWHLKIYWRVPESLNQIPRSLHPHLQWWLKEDNVLTGQPLHPIKHALQIFTDASKEGWGARLNERAARGSWSPPESRRHINHLDLKAVFLTLKEFQGLCSNKVLLLATNNTTVVSYINNINKEGDMSGQLCALLWRILTWCTNK